MQQPDPSNESLDIVDAQEQFPRIVREIREHGTPTYIEEDGERVAVVVSSEEYLELQRAKARRVLSEIGRLFKDESPEDIERETLRISREVREQLYQENLSQKSDQ